MVSRRAVPFKRLPLYAGCGAVYAQIMAKKRRRRRTSKLSGAARAAKKAPKACKVRLSRCMTGTKSKRAKAACMRAFNRCRV